MDRPPVYLTVRFADWVNSQAGVCWLADHGFTDREITRLQNGCRVPRLPIIQRLAAGFDTTPSTVLVWIVPDATVFWQACVDKALDASSLAVRLGVHRTSVRDWFTGRVIPAPDMVGAIADVLGLSRLATARLLLADPGMPELLVRLYAAGRSVREMVEGVFGYRRRYDSVLADPGRVRPEELVGLEGLVGCQVQAGWLDELSAYHNDGRVRCVRVCVDPDVFGVLVARAGGVERVAGYVGGVIGDHVADQSGPPQAG